MPFYLSSFFKKKASFNLHVIFEELNQNAAHYCEFNDFKIGLHDIASLILVIVSIFKTIIDTIFIYSFQ